MKLARISDAANPEHVGDLPLRTTSGRGAARRSWETPPGLVAASQRQSERASGRLTLWYYRRAEASQIRNVASLPVVGPHVAIMPDAHWGNGACVGSVIPTKFAIIPAAVGVDLSCGMMATKTDLTVNDLEGKLPALRAALENQIPVGGPGLKGSWPHTPRPVEMVFERELEDAYERILAKHPQIGARGGHPAAQLGTLGSREVATTATSAGPGRRHSRRSGVSEAKAPRRWNHKVKKSSQS